MKIKKIPTKRTPYISFRYIPFDFFRLGAPGQHQGLSVSLYSGESRNTNESSLSSLSRVRENQDDVSFLFLPKKTPRVNISYYMSKQVEAELKPS